MHAHSPPARFTLAFRLPSTGALVTLTCMMKSSLLLALLLSTATLACAEGNKFGIMTHLTCPSFDPNGGGRHIALAASMCGEWGWVRQLVTADPDESAASARFIVLCRAHKLTPILYINAFSKSAMDRSMPQAQFPKADADGSFSTVADVTAEWLEGIRDLGVEVPYLELWNEPNLAEGWGNHPDPVQYAKYHMAVGRVVRRVSPRTKILNAALANSTGTDDNHDGRSGREGDANLDSFYFMEQMLRAEPGMADLIDIWSSHSYPFNHPPEFSQDRFCVGAYRYEMDHYRSFTNRTLPVIITETGYRLGDHADNRFPEVTEDWRVAWTVGSYFKVWLDDPNLLGVCPFILGNHLYGSEDPRWEPYAWSTPDFQPKSVLVAVASLPHTKGTDYLPSGPGSIHGTTRLGGADNLVTGTVVWVTPGGYAAVSDGSGHYEITGLPVGDYTLHAEASCFNAPTRPVRVGTGAEQADISMDSVGLLPDGTMERPWYEHTDDFPTTCTYSPDAALRANPTDGCVTSPCLELAGPISVHQDTDYVSVRPGEQYQIRAAYRYVPEPGAPAESSATLIMSVVPFLAHVPNASELRVTTATLAQAGPWRTLESTITPRDKWTQRLRVILTVDAPDGAVLFDDVAVEPVGGRNVIR